MTAGRVRRSPRLALLALALTSACGSGEAASGTTVTGSTTSTTSTTTSSTTVASVVSTPRNAPVRVGWVGGSEVALEELSLPAIATAREAEVGGRPLVFDPYTVIAASADDTRRQVELAGGSVDVLVVTLNPQWLWGRECAFVEPPHTRYACLLEDGPVTGGEAIAATIDAVVTSERPAVFVLMPTSQDALGDPLLGGLVANANALLRSYLPPGAVVVDESLTAGEPEFAEGAGFHDMVHPTAAGAELIVTEVIARLIVLIG